MIKLLMVCRQYLFFTIKIVEIYYITVIYIYPDDHINLYFYIEIQTHPTNISYQLSMSNNHPLQNKLFDHH